MSAEAPKKEHRGINASVAPRSTELALSAFLLLLVCKYKNNVTASKKSYGLSKLPHFALSENRRFTLVNRESEFVLC